MFGVKCQYNCEFVLFCNFANFSRLEFFWFCFVSAATARSCSLESGFTFILGSHIKDKRILGDPSQFNIAVQRMQHFPFFSFLSSISPSTPPPMGPSCILPCWEPCCHPFLLVLILAFPAPCSTSTGHHKNIISTTLGFPVDSLFPPINRK